MNRSPYTRLFLGTTISKADEVDSSYEAAIVLWGKDNADDTISVLDAVSFGPRDISEEAKEDWSEHHANRLPVIGIEQWRRPTDADAAPVKLGVPSTGLLYKVTSGKRNADRDYEYLLDTLGDDLNDMEVDLLRLSFTIYMKTAAGEDDESTDNDEEEES